MNAPLSIDDVRRDPLRLAANLRTAAGLGFTVRPLTPRDGGILGKYFLGLSERTKALYAPHPFDLATADALCAGTDYADTIRFIAVLPGGPRGKGIGYIILKLGLTPGERERYPRAGVEVDPSLDCLVAPSVADAYQGLGLGTPCLRHVMGAARQLGRRYCLLMGGVYADNERAVQFYRKAGFRLAASFTLPQAGARPAFDMYLAL
jgi:GNAT superfamily N-acetyltransferase